MVELPSNIVALQDEDEFINNTVYADPGVGKTVFAGSDDDVLFIAPEDNGTISAKRLGSTAKKWQIRSLDRHQKRLQMAGKPGCYPVQLGRA